jgi:hypothetical protein
MKKILFFAGTLLALQFVTSAQTINTIQKDGQKLMVADMSFMGRVTWGGYEEIGKAAASEENGKANTAAIVATVGANKGQEGKPYAAKICDTLKTGGFDDWYLPCKNETVLIQANYPQLKMDEKTTIWSSTEANGTQAVTMYFYSGAFYNVQKVDLAHLVCVRKPE